MGRQRRATVIVAAIVTIAMMLVGAVFVVQAHAADDFTRLYNTQTNGTIVATGNVLSSCNPKADSTCDTARNREIVKSNNDFAMSYVDADDDSSTFNSSMAHVTVPSDAKVLKAYLFWSATLKSPDTPNRSIKFKVPGGQYRTISPASSTAVMPGSNYNAFSTYADVTDMVVAGGSGDYWAADLEAAQQLKDRYAAWGLVVVIEDPKMPPRDLSVYEGSLVISSGTKTATVSGFLTPKTGVVNAKVGSIIWEGDRTYSGDYMTLNNVRLGDALNDSGNFFSGVVSRDGEYITDRLPNYRNTMGVDAKVVDTSGVLPNSAKNAKVTFGTNGDVYYVGALTTQIDLYVPDITPAKSMINISAGERGDDPSAPARPGDILEYTIAMVNKGQDTATNLYMRDPIPQYTDYVPGSLRLISGDTTKNLSDDRGDDEGDFTGDSVVVRAGNGASGSQGGELPFQAAATVKFRVKLTDASAGKEITNTARANYNGATEGKNTDRSSNVNATPVVEAADVAVTKSGPTRVNAGETIQWTVTASNNGPSAAQDVTVTDEIPAEVTNPTVVSPFSGCQVNDHNVTCSLGTLPQGQSREIHLSGQLPTSMDASVTSILNTAKVSSSTVDLNRSNNTASVPTTIGRSADVVMSKKVTDNPTPVPGQKVIFDLTATNRGPSTAEAVAVTDALPNGLVLSGQPTTTAGTCTSNDESITCELGNLDSGQSAVVTVTATVPASWTSTEPITNTAVAQSVKTPDPDTSNNTSSVTVTPQKPQADLVADKTFDSASLVPGRQVTYNVNIRNAGPSVATDVTAIDILPQGLTLVSASSAGEKCKTENNTVSCHYDTLAVGSRKSVTIVANVDPGLTGNVTNTATVSSSVTDPNPDNNTSSVTTPAAPTADLTLTKTMPPKIVSAGEVVDFALTVSNAGPSTARDVHVTDTLPAPLELVSASGLGFTCSTSGVSVDCAIDSLEPSSQARVNVKAKIPANADVGGDTTIINTATTSSSTPDSNPDNNTASLTVPTTTAADLQILKDGPARLNAGETATWTLTVTNNGPSDASSVSISDVLPAQIDPMTARVSTTSGPLSCSLKLTDLTCTAPTLANGDSSEITVSATVRSDITDAQMSNTARVNAATSDPTDSNNSSTVTTEIGRLADLSVTKSGPATAVAGEDITYTLHVENKGPSQATSISLVDALPTGMVFLGTDSAECTGDGKSQSVICEISTLASGQSQDITIKARILAGTPTDKALTNIVNIDSATPDPDPSNNHGEAATQLTARAALTIVKSAQPQVFVAGTDAVYLLTVTNAGPSSAKNVVVSDDVPAGLTPTAVQGPGTCSIDGQKVTCALDWLSPNAERPATIRVDVAVDSAVTGSLTNTATVTTSTPLDPTSVGSSTITTQVDSRADVVMEKTTEATTVYAGAGMTWQLTATNKGPSQANAVVITDTLPAAMTLTDVPDSCTYADDTRVLTCPVGTLASGASYSVEVSVAIDPDYDAQAHPELTNSATVTTSTTDPNPDNDTSEKSVTVKQYSRMDIEKTAPTTAVVAGNSVEWLITVRNEGPSNAHGVVVTDNVDPALVVESALVDNGESCQITGQDIRCNLDNVEVGATTVRITTAIAPGYEGSNIPNAAVITTGTPSNATPPLVSLTNINVIQKADLALTKSVQALDADGHVREGAPVAGERMRYTFVMTNKGPSTSPATTLYDVLPAGLSDITFDQADGTCELDSTYADPNGHPTSGKFICTRPQTISVGKTWTVTLDATLQASTITDVVNTALVSGHWADPDGTNNESTATLTPQTKADVSLVKTLESRIVPGERATWKLTVTNAGPSNSAHVSLTDPMPDGVTDATVDSVSDPALSCTVTDGVVRCVSDTVAPGTSIDVLVSGLVDSTWVDSIVNTAQVTTTTPDSDVDNNSSSAGGDPEPASTVHVVKSTESTEVKRGDEIHWRLTITNDGPSQARKVALTDVIDENLTAGAITADDDYACAIDNRTLHCLIGSLDAGATTTIDYVTTVTDTAPAGSLANTVSVVTPHGGDSTPSMDQSTATVTVTVPQPPSKPALMTPGSLAATGGYALIVGGLAVGLLGAGQLLLSTRRRRSS